MPRQNRIACVGAARVTGPAIARSFANVATERPPVRHIARLPLLVLMPPLPLAVHGGELHPLEGDLGLTRLVVLELPPIEGDIKLCKP